MAREYTVVIAHRLSTVRGTVRIYALEGGTTVERSRLLERDGAYADLYAAQ